MILVNRNDLVLPFVESRLDSRGSFNLPHCQSLGLVRDGVLVGGAVYDNWNGYSCHIHVAGAYTGWIIPCFIYAAFYYPFEYSGLQKLIGPVASDNHVAIEFDQRLGFKLESKITDVYGKGIDCLLMTMRRDECKWLPRAREWIKGTRLESSAPEAAA